MVYHLETLAWMKTKDAQRKIPQHRPQPYVPDFMRTGTEPGTIDDGKETHTTDDIRDILAMRRVESK